MKYKGKDAPRLPATHPTAANALVWNTDYDYSATAGLTVNQSIRQAYPQSLATLRSLISTAAVNGETEVGFQYYPGGYSVVTQRNRATSVDANGNVVRDDASAISVAWAIEGVDEQISIWSHQPTVDLLDNFTGWAAQGALTKRDLQIIWRAMTDAYAGGERTYEIEPAQGTPLKVWLSESVLLNYFQLFCDGTANAPRDALAASLIQTLAAGHETVSRSSYVVSKIVQTTLAYSATASVYAHVDQYWTQAQLTSEFGASVPLPTIVGKWLKKAPVQHYRTGTSLEFTLRWEQERNPQGFLYQDNPTKPPTP